MDNDFSDNDFWKHYNWEIVNIGVAEIPKFQNTVSETGSPEIFEKPNYLNKIEVIS